MTRREEKMRAEKEKMMQEEDPERQRRLEVCHQSSLPYDSESVQSLLVIEEEHRVLPSHNE